MERSCHLRHGRRRHGRCEAGGRHRAGERRHGRRGRGHSSGPRDLRQYSQGAALSRLNQRLGNICHAGSGAVQSRRAADADALALAQSGDRRPAGLGARPRAAGERRSRAASARLLQADSRARRFPPHATRRRGHGKRGAYGLPQHKRRRFRWRGAGEHRHLPRPDLRPVAA